MSRRSSTSPAWPTPSHRRCQARVERAVPNARDRSSPRVGGRFQRHGAGRVARSGRLRRFEPGCPWNRRTSERAMPGSASAQRVGVNQLRGWSPTRYGTLDVTGAGLFLTDQLSVRHLRGRCPARFPACWGPRRRAGPHGRRFAVGRADGGVLQRRATAGAAGVRRLRVRRRDRADPRRPGADHPGALGDRRHESGDQAAGRQRVPPLGGRGRRALPRREGYEYRIPLSARDLGAVPVLRLHHALSRVPLSQVIQSAYAHLARWVDGGAPPPSAPYLEFDGRRRCGTSWGSRRAASNCRRSRCRQPSTRAPTGSFVLHPPGHAPPLRTRRSSTSCIAITGSTERVARNAAECRRRLPPAGGAEEHQRAAAQSPAWRVGRDATSSGRACSAFLPLAPRREGWSGAERPTMQGEGFEPPKAEPTGLQPVPFGRSGTPPGAAIVASALVERFDAVVVGAGPAGSTAAIGSRARARACCSSTGRASRATSRAAAGSRGRAVRAAAVRVDAGRRGRRRPVRASGFGYGRRFERRSARAARPDDAAHRRLDHFLAEQAAAAGADLRDGVKVEGLTVGRGRSDDPDRRRGRSRPTSLVGADGVNGRRADARARRRHRLRRRARGERPVRRCPDRRYRGTPRSSSGSSPAATAGSSRRATTSTSASAAGRSEGPRLRDAPAPALRASTGSTTAQLDEPARLPAAAPPAGDALARGRSLLVGDAAGLVDPLSGDGMYEAFVSAAARGRGGARLLAGGPSSRYEHDAARGARPLRAAASWGAKLALDRFPRPTFAIARLPAVWRVVERLLGGDLAPPERVAGAAGRDPRDRRAARAAGNPGAVYRRDSST